MCCVRIIHIKRGNSALRRHLKTSTFLYAIFGSGTLFWHNSEFPKTTFFLRIIQATIIMRPIQKCVLIAINTFANSKRKLNHCLWLGFMLLHVMKMFAMFINGIRERNLLTSALNDIVKIDRNIQEFSRKKSRSSWYNYKLYFVDIIGLTFLVGYHIIKTMKDVSIFIDITFFVRVLCVLMHSSFCKLVYVTFQLFRNMNEQCIFLKESDLSQVRSILSIRILTVQHRSIVRVWRKLVQFYEPYLLFEVLSVFLDMLYVTNKVYSYCFDKPRNASDLQAWHIPIGALWSMFEMISICMLCNKVEVEVSQVPSYCLLFYKVILLTKF